MTSPRRSSADRREDEVRARVESIKKQVLYMLNLRCVPPGPPDSAAFGINPEYIQILHNLMQNQTDSDSEDLLKRAQSFYPTCESILPCRRQQLNARDFHAVNSSAITLSSNELYFTAQYLACALLSWSIHGVSRWCASARYRCF